MPEGVASDVLKLSLRCGLVCRWPAEDDSLHWVQSFLERRPPALRGKKKPFGHNHVVSFELRGLID